MGAFGLRFQVKHMNQNGQQIFAGAKYRLLNSKGKEVLSGKTNDEGFTDYVYTDKSEKIYIQFLNLRAVGGRPVYEIPALDDVSLYALTQKAKPTYYCVVLRSYFQALLIGMDKKILSNQPYRITMDDGNKKQIIERNTDNYGKTVLISTSNGLVFSNDNDKIRVILKNLASSNKPFLKLETLLSRTSKNPEHYPRLIPIGSKFQYREISIGAKSGATENNNNNKVTGLENSIKLRDVFITFKMRGNAGKTYTIKRIDNGGIFDPSMKQVKEISFQDGKPIKISLPENYNGYINIYLGNSFYTKLLIPKIVQGDKDTRLTYILNNVETIDDVRKVHFNDDEFNMFTFQSIKGKALKGTHTINELVTMNIESLKDICITLVSYLNAEQLAKTYKNSTLQAIVGYINDEIHAKTLVQTIIIPFFSLSGIVKDEIKIVVQQTINGHKLIGLLAHARVKLLLNTSLIVALGQRVSQLGVKQSLGTLKNFAKLAKASVVGIVCVTLGEIMEYIAGDDTDICTLMGGLIAGWSKILLSTAFFCAIVAAISLLIPLAPFAIIVILGAVAAYFFSVKLDEWDEKFGFTVKVKELVRNSYNTNFTIMVSLILFSAKINQKSKDVLKNFGIVLPLFWIFR